MFVDTGKSYTYGDIERFSNQVANHFVKAGLKAGDVVAIFMENKPGQHTTQSSLKFATGCRFLFCFGCRVLHDLAGHLQDGRPMRPD